MMVSLIRNLHSQRLYSGQHDLGRPSGPVKAPPSNITSADSTDYEDVENAGDLLAPLEVLRALANVAVARAIQVRAVTRADSAVVKNIFRKTTIPVNHIARPGLQLQRGN